jgi:hypothetical protein
MKVVRIDERAANRDRGRIEVAPASGERARLLMREARSAAIEHLETLEAAIRVARDLSLEVQQGGDIYGVGVRDLAARLAEDLLWRGKSLEGLTARERAGLLAH